MLAGGRAGPLQRELERAQIDRAVSVGVEDVPQRVHGVVVVEAQHTYIIGRGSYFFV
tara:strand:+ start:290 stop:460 length:171 start_codon:yes stop_codon:yes gene_type:complete